MSSVDKCVCHNRTFSEIKKLAERKNLSTIKELQAENICSSSCGLCIPYIKLMLKTGETEFAPGAPYKHLNKE